jgi:hypothetical protein
MRRQAPIKRSPSGQRTIANTKATDVTALDDRPLAIHLSRDGKHLLVALPTSCGCSTSPLSKSNERSNSAPPSPRPRGQQGRRPVDRWSPPPLRQHLLHHCHQDRHQARRLRRPRLPPAPRPPLRRRQPGRGPVGHRQGDPGPPPQGLRTPRPRPRPARRTAPCGPMAPRTPGSSTLSTPPATCSSSCAPPAPPRSTPRASSPLGLSTAHRPPRCLLAARDGAVAWTGRQLRIDRTVPPPRTPRRPLPSPSPAMSAGSTSCARAASSSASSSSNPSPPPAKKTTLSPLPEAEECRLEWPAECMLLHAPALGSRPSHLRRAPGRRHPRPPVARRPEPL